MADPRTARTPSAATSLWLDSSLWSPLWRGFRRQLHRALPVLLRQSLPPRIAMNLHADVEPRTPQPGRKLGILFLGVSLPPLAQKLPRSHPLSSSSASRASSWALL